MLSWSLGQRQAYEPAPTTTLDGSSSRVELGLERFEGTECLDDFVFEDTIREFTAIFLLGRKVFPEQGVVNVTYS